MPRFQDLVLRNLETYKRHEWIIYGWTAGAVLRAVLFLNCLFCQNLSGLHSCRSCHFHSSMGIYRIIYASWDACRYAWVSIMPLLLCVSILKPSTANRSNSQAAMNEGFCASPLRSSGGGAPKVGWWLCHQDEIVIPGSKVCYQRSFKTSHYLHKYNPSIFTADNFDLSLMSVWRELRTLSVTLDESILNYQGHLTHTIPYPPGKLQVLSLDRAFPGAKRRRSLHSLHTWLLGG